MKIKNHSKGTKGFGTRLIAFFLVAGGLLGIAGAGVSGYHFALRQETVRMLSTLVSVVLFGWGILAGVELWQGSPRGIKWAKIMLALQVPVFSMAHVLYEHSTFLSFRVMIGNTTRHFGADLGSSSNIYLSGPSLGPMFGINIIAVLALLYLISRSRQASTNRLPAALPAGL